MDSCEDRLRAVKLCIKLGQPWTAAEASTARRMLISFMAVHSPKIGRMWHPLETIAALAGAFFGAIVVVALLGSGPGGWLILLGIVALLAAVTPWDTRRRKQEAASQAWLEDMREARRRHEASIREDRIREMQDRLHDGR